MYSRHPRVIYLLASTALSVVPLFGAHAQSSTSTSAINIDLGSVTATGVGAYVAPSGTGTLSQAIAKQKLAPNVIFVQPASVMRQLPDADVAENLQHVPGVQMQQDSGFGRFLTIRGLSSDLNATDYAGIGLPATNINANPTGGSRAVALDFLPPGVIGGAEVIASLTPSMPATGLGGVINLLPPTLPDNGQPMLDITAAGGYSKDSGHGVFQGNLMAGTHFAIPGMTHFQNDKPFSVIFSYGYYNTSPGISDVEEAYTNPTVSGAPAVLNTLQLRHYSNNRTSKGYTGELDFDPNNQVHLYVRGLYSAVGESIQKNELYLQNIDGTGTPADSSVTDNGNNSFTATGANLNKYYENSFEQWGLGFVEGGGNVTVDNFVTVNFHSAYAAGFDRFTRDYITNFGSNDQNLTINYNTNNPARRSYTVQTASGGFYDPTNPANYTFSNSVNNAGRWNDQIYDNGASASVPTILGSAFGTFEAGFDTQLRSRNALFDHESLTPNNGNYPLSDVTGGNPSQSDYGGLYPVGPNINYDTFFSIPYTVTPNTISNLQSYQHDSENVYAGFGQETLQYGKLSLLAGVRVEATNATYSSFGSSDGVVNSQLTTKAQNYVNVFPSAQLTYAFTNQLQARVAYSTGIARPGFQQANPAITFTSQGGQGGRDLISSGNPNLKPQTGRSIDFVLAYYPSSDDVLEADAFLKTFQNYIISSVTNTTTTTFQSFSNINGARARGVVLQAIHHFHELPGALSGLSINANATFVDATADVIQGQGRSILPSSYPFTFNVTEGYDLGRVHAYLSQNYTSRDLFTVGSGPSTNVYTQPIFAMDLNLEYDVTPHWQAFFQVHNLTNRVLEFTQSASTQFPIQREYYGQDFLLGVHYHL